MTEEETALIFGILEQVALLQDVEGSIGGSDLLTHHFTRLFTQIGFSIKFPLLRKSRDWFVKLQDSHVNSFKIQSLVDLGEENSPYIKEQIEKLLKENRMHDGRFHLPTGFIPQGDLFSTLVAVSILLSLENHEKYDQYIEDALNWVIKNRTDFNSERDRGFAVLTMARYDPEKFEDAIASLVVQIREALANTLQSKKKLLRPDSMENVCWIIYDLMPLYDKNPEVKRIVEELVSILRTDILPVVSESFTRLDAYWKVMLGTRIVMALSSYHGESFIDIIYEQLAFQRILGFKYYVKQEILKKREFYEGIVRKWIRLETGDPEDLGGGLSGARILRLRSSLSIPGLTQKIDMPSLIVKIGDRVSFEKEKDSYHMIPGPLRVYFANILGPTFQVNIDGEVVQILVMEDLVNYGTLHEILASDKSIDEKNEALKKTCDWLKLIYSSSMKLSDKQDNAISKIYVSDMLKSISSIIASGEVSSRIEDDLKDIALIINKMSSENRFLHANMLTLMHGDLNSRNIMTYSDENGFNMKLIDINKLSMTGDSAFDLGELAIDLEFSVGSANLAKLAEQSFVEFARSKDDKTFERRLILGKTRSLLKLSKISADRGEVEQCRKLVKIAKRQLKLIEEVDKNKQSNTRGPRVNGRGL